MTAEPRSIYVMQFELARAKETVADLEAELTAATAKIQAAAVARAQAIDTAQASRPRRFDELISRA